MARRDVKVDLFKGYMRGCYETVSDAMGRGDFASLRDLHFWKSDSDSDPHVPDYSNPVTIAYYQLRYACGYAFEYYVAYRLALEWLKQMGCEDLSVVSLGSGSGIDRYSLEIAICDTDFGRNCYLDRKNANGIWEGDGRRWLGVDIAEWGKPEKVTSKGFPAHDNVVQIMDGGAAGYFQAFAREGDECARNVFFFPRILSELEDERLMDDLARAIASASYSEDKFVVCIANRTAPNDEGEQEKVEQANSRRVISAFEEAGFRQSGPLPENVIASLGFWDEADYVLDAGNPDHPYAAPYFRIRGQGGRWNRVRINDLEFGKGFCLADDIADFMAESNDSMSKPHEMCPNRCDGCAEECPDADVRGENEEKKCPLAYNPVNSTSQMNLQIVMFERAGR